MGLLTSDAAGRQKAKLARWLIKGNTLICFLLYALGIAYFWMLSHRSFTNATYFSENALLPGLVYSEIKSDTVNQALQFHEELEHERKTHRSSTPHAWLLAKMRQIGLDTFTHNFTLNYPFGGGKVYTGRNVYGILRAPRIGSTESFVITAPYRPPDSLHPAVSHSVPVLLAFASHARKQKYWAKDLIFLVTEQEQLGMQAWLQAYKGATSGSHSSDNAPILNAGTLEDRAGSIQAAINLELQSFDTEFVDIKIEGLNGQLPNLDLVNLVQRIALKEGIPCGHQKTSRKRYTGAMSTQVRNFQHMLSMVLTQASGVPNGNHGLFHRYGIEAVTLEGYRTESTNSQRKSNGAAALLRLIEGVSRSINNLLERFHQSFFFYLIVSSDRFVSIGDYMPSLALMVAVLLVKALIQWLSIVNIKSSDDAEDDEVDNALDYNFIGVGKVIFLVHAIGLCASYIPSSAALNNGAHSAGIPTEHYIFGLFASVSICAKSIPMFLSLSYVSIQILHIAALLELATALLVLGMLNFSFAFLLAVIAVPLAILIRPVPRVRVLNISPVVAVLLNPLVLIYLIVFAVTAYNFNELTFCGIAARALSATAEAITFSVTDSMIYGNWVFDVVIVLFLPIWTCLWTVALSLHQTAAPPIIKLKQN